MIGLSTENMGAALAPRPMTVGLEPISENWDKVLTANLL